MLSDKLKHVSRRDLLRLTKQYGISSTLLAAGSMTGVISATRLAGMASRYGLAELSASYTSETATTRASSGIDSPANPSG